MASPKKILISLVVSASIAAVAHTQVPGLGGTWLSIRFAELGGGKQVQEITLPPNEKFIGMAGHAQHLLSTRKMRADEQPEVIKIYNSDNGSLTCIVKEWRQ